MPGAKINSATITGCRDTPQANGDHILDAVLEDGSMVQAIIPLNQIPGIVRALQISLIKWVFDEVIGNLPAPAPMKAFRSRISP